MARPQTSSSWKTGETEGIDIMLALDISTSMATNDILPSRITAAKDVALNFISNRPNDNIGLTLFGGEAYTQCPLTTDHAMLVQTFKGATCTLQNDGIIQPGTAIGMGIASAVSHLNDSHAKSKVIILLTDGANNTGEISPLMATDMAKSAGIRIYTILLGKDGKVNVPVAQLPNGEVYTQQIDDTVDPTAGVRRCMPCGAQTGIHAHRRPHHIAQNSTRNWRSFLSRHLTWFVETGVRRHW